MYIVQIQHTIDDLDVNLNRIQFGEIKRKECRLIEYDSLDEIIYHIENDTREHYIDNYLDGCLCPMCPDIITKDVREHEVNFIFKLFNGKYMWTRFIEII